jgi:hypothetical protein
MKFNRIQLLNTLECLTPGVATSRDMIEQSNCVLFIGSYAYTYNDEICCRAKLEQPMPVVGAIPLAPLTSILHKLKDEELDVVVVGDDTELLITGKGSRKCGLRYDSAIEFQPDAVPFPKSKRDWITLPEGFTSRAVKAAACACKDSSKYNIACVHITPTRIEATDNSQAIRFNIPGKAIQKQMLIRASSLRELHQLQPTRLATDKTWAYFKNARGLAYAIRQDAAEDGKFPDLSTVLDDSDTEPLSFPRKPMLEAISRAETFSSEESDANMLQVTLDGKKQIVRVKGVGVSGWYSEPKKIEYQGKTLKFLISPEVFTALLEQDLPARVNDDRLLIGSESMKYCVALEPPSSDGK